MMNFWANEPDKFFVYPKRSRKPHELPNPDQSLIIGYCNDRNIHIGPLSTRYNLNGRHERDANTKIIHFNVNLVKPWGVSKKMAREQSMEAGLKGDWVEKTAWDNILDWHRIEERANLIYSEDTEQE